MTSSSKNKGNRGERLICDFLGKLYNASFQRVPGSGSFIGGKNIVRKDTLSESQILLARGDIIPPDNLKKMVIESKNYKEFPFHNLIQNENVPLLDTWIEQVTHDATDEDTWFIIFKINRKGTFVVFDKKISESVEIENCIYYNDYIITKFESFFTNNKDVIAKLCG